MYQNFVCPTCFTPLFPQPNAEYIICPLCGVKIELIPITSRTIHKEVQHEFVDKFK